MEPTKLDLELPGWNAFTWAADQKPYRPLPCLQSTGQRGEVLTRWRLTWWERLRLVFGADLWLMQLTFHHRLQPLTPFVGQPEFQVEETPDLPAGV